MKAIEKIITYYNSGQSHDLEFDLQEHGCENSIHVRKLWGKIILRMHAHTHIILLVHSFSLTYIILLKI